MSRANTIQTNFTAGEVSPLMYGRVDVSKYANGAKKLQNMIVRPQGGAKRRPGTRYVNNPKYTNLTTALREFIFSETQSYVLEFGDQYFRVYKDGAIVESSPGVPVEVATTYVYGHVLSLRFTQSADVLYVTHPSYPPRKITRTSHTSWSITTITTTDGPYLDRVDSNTTGAAKLIVSSQVDRADMYSTGTVPFAGTSGDNNKYIEYKVGSLWRVARVSAFGTTSHATVDIIDGIFDANPGAKLTYNGAEVVSDVTGVFSTAEVGKIVRISSGVWYTMSAFVNSSKMTATALTTFITYTYPTTTVYVSNRTVTATLTSDIAIFASTDVGRLFRLEFGIAQRYGTITAYSSTTSVSVTLNLPVPLDQFDGGKYYQNGRADGYRLGAFNSVTGYPGAVCFHEQRLTFARSNSQPQTFWMSKSGDYENFAPTGLDSTVSADNAITYTIASNKANPIVWMESGPVLLIGTIGSEFQVKPSSLNEALTPQNIDIKEQTRFGSVSTDRAHRVGSAVLFVQRGGKKVREMMYNFNIDAYESKDLTILSEHILRTEVYSRSSHFQITPVCVLWVAAQSVDSANLNTTVLLGMTYERDQEVIAWHRHVLGGNVTRPDCTVESLAVVPSTDGVSDNLYMVVARHDPTNSFAIKRYIERMEIDWDADNESAYLTTGANSNQFFVDCGLTYSGSPATTISGLSHLNGEVVQVLADGAYIGTKTVSAGAITLSAAASKVQVGFGFTSIITTLDPEGGSPAGTSQGKIKRISRVAVRVNNSYPFNVGPTESRLTRVTNFSGKFTGDVVVTLDQGYSYTSGFTITQDQPYALNVNAIMPSLNTNE